MHSTATQTTIKNDSSPIASSAANLIPTRNRLATTCLNSLRIFGASVPKLRANEVNLLPPRNLFEISQLHDSFAGLLTSESEDLAYWKFEVAEYKKLADNIAGDEAQRESQVREEQVHGNFEGMLRKLQISEDAKEKAETDLRKSNGLNQRLTAKLAELALPHFSANAKHLKAIENKDAEIQTQLELFQEKVVELSEATNALENSNTKKDTAEASLKEVNEKFQKLEEEKTTVNSNLTEANNQVETLTTEKSKVENQLSDLRDETVAAERTASEELANVQKKNEKSEANTKINGLQKELEDLQATNKSGETTAAGELKVAKDRVSHLETEAEESATKIQNLETDISQANNKVTKLEQETKVSASTIKQLEEQEEKDAEATKRITQEAEASTKRIAELEKKKSEAEEASKKEISKLQGLITQLEGENAQATEIAQTATSELQKVRTERDDLNTELAAAKQQVEALNTEKADAANKANKVLTKTKLELQKEIPLQYAVWQKDTDKNYDMFFKRITILEPSIHFYVAIVAFKSTVMAQLATEIIGRLTRSFDKLGVELLVEAIKIFISKVPDEKSMQFAVVTMAIAQLVHYLTLRFRRICEFSKLDPIFITNQLQERVNRCDPFVGRFFKSIPHNPQQIIPALESEWNDDIVSFDKLAIVVEPSSNWAMIIQDGGFIRLVEKTLFEIDESRTSMLGYVYILRSPVTTPMEFEVKGGDSVVWWAKRIESFLPQPQWMLDMMERVRRGEDLNANLY
ncbi:hypothetical protein G7Y89_g274 [Cudoniella acicularis]|uniref:Uncharacterized protein n=1 Tax=Cudoniella acicularis TaxID=354080 RepID=A0A8H4RZ45_9HELO|nr:hypothetical protein G7Y89_g274 [Cudoniella acicularis]